MRNEKLPSSHRGGHVEDPTYRQGCGAGTGHAEVVRVTFDPAVIRHRDPLEVSFAIRDPTTRGGYLKRTAFQRDADPHLVVLAPFVPPYDTSIPPALPA